MAPTALYTPPPNLKTNLAAFTAYINKTHNLSLSSYADLHNFSVTRLNDFWLSFWGFADIKSSTPPKKAIDDNARIDEFPAFFPDVRLNYAENLLFGQGKDDDATAVIELSESTLTSPKMYSWKDLRALVAKYVGVLSRASIKKGDVIVLVGGNCVRSLAFLLAAASIGAIFASFTTDIGEKALLDRVAQLKPKLVIAELQYRYNGRVNDISGKIKKCVGAVEGCAFIASMEGEDMPRGGQRLSDLLPDEKAEDLKFEQVPFSTPFVVMFSSGTTGTPKGIVHSQGGLTLNGKKSHMLQNNFGPGDVHFHYSGIGWTLWNISLGAMIAGAAMVLYDGSPFHPSPEEFLKAVLSQGVTGYGGSPRFFSELQKLNVKPKEFVNLRRLKTVLSTGALLTPGTARYLADAFGGVCQINFTGGTELCGNFFGGCVELPSYAGEITVKELGMDVVAMGDDGREVKDGEAGELVCRKPFPNMPVMLWNDPEYKRYKKSYFSGFKGVWTHGDLIRVNTETGGTYVLGRSDGVLNPSGVRFGTSELYNILSSPEHGLNEKVLDGLAVGQQRNTEEFSDPTERVILFLKVAEGQSSGGISPRQDVVESIKALITRDLSRRHIPHFFFEVQETPHNANGKKMEIQVKQVCNGGGRVLEKMTLTEAERGMLEGFVKFYRIEDFETSKKENKGRRDSKL